MKTLITCFLIIIALQAVSYSGSTAHEAVKLTVFVEPGDVEMFVYLTPDGAIIATPKKLETIHFTYLCSRIIKNPVFEVALPKKQRRHYVTD